MRSIPLAALLCAVATVNGLSAQQGTTKTYDTVTDTTFFTLKGSSLVDESGKPTGLTLRVFASFPGDDAPRDAVVSLGFISASRNWRYAAGDTERLRLTVDGGPELKIGPLRHEWTTNADGSVFQQIWLEVTPELLRTLGRATRVQGLLGDLRFVLNSQQLDALRALGSELSATR